MKKILLLIVALLGAAVSRADEKSDKVLGEMARELKRHSSYRMDFTATAEGMMPDTKGYLVISGDRFYINVDPVEVYGDGRVKYEVNHENREVVIDRIVEGDRNLLSNPAKALDFLDGSFAHSYDGGSGTERVVRLRPLSEMGFDDVLLYVGRDGLPVKVVYSVDGMGVPIEVAIDKFGRTESDIHFDKGKYEGYELIDFR